MLSASDCSRIDRLTGGDKAAGPVRRAEFSTHDEAETEEFIRRTYVGSRTRFLSMGEDARFSVKTAVAGEVAADHVRSTADYETETEEFDYFLFGSMLNGRMHIKRRGEDEVIVSAGEHCFYPLGVPMLMTAVDYEIRALRVSVERLQRTAVEIAGSAGSELRFEAITPVSDAMGRHWWAVLSLVTGTVLADDSVMAQPLLAEELIRMAATAALHTFPNSLMRQQRTPRPGRVGSAALRRAAAFIEDRAQSPITLSEIAGAAGASPRALQYAFRRHHGVTPMEHLRRVRLEHAHRELRAADPALGATVAEIGRRWGFPNPSRFAGYYRDVYGRAPSDTLRPG